MYSIGMFRIPYTSFTYRNAQVKNELMNSFESVLDSGNYILGSEVQKFEADLANFVGTKHAIGMSNGTCSLHLALKTLGLQKGDEVITPTNSFIASTASIVLSGYVPVLVDVDDDLNISVDKLEGAISVRTRAIMVVHLAGRPAKMNQILDIAKKYNLIVIEDAAQSIGSMLFGKRVGTFGEFASFSLHPLKNLHGYGDAGAIVTNSYEIDKKLRLTRNHGLVDRETCLEFSYNCRIDELQAGLIRVNLSKLEEWTEERRWLAKLYNQRLRDYVVTPEEGPGEYHVYQTYVIRTHERDSLLNHLRNSGVEANVHYKNPIHSQKAIEGAKVRVTEVSNAEKLSKQILSLPLYPGLQIDAIEEVVEIIREYLETHEIPRPI